MEFRKNMIKYKFFWNGTPFSNWWIVDFVGDCNIKFNCVEQYMMFEKAMFFNDTDTAILILCAKTPKEQKENGNFQNDKNWNIENGKVIEE